MRIGQLSATTGLSRDTLRFYEKRGLLVSRRLENGYRDYLADSVNWLQYLRTAKSLGFTLSEIEADLPLLAVPDRSAPAIREALRKKLSDIDARIVALGDLRTELASRLAGVLWGWIGRYRFKRRHWKQQHAYRGQRWP